MEYQMTDEASEGTSITVEADSAQAALDSYIASALADPWSYNQGEEGVSARIRAYVFGDDGIEAEGVIDFFMERDPAPPVAGGREPAIHKPGEDPDFGCQRPGSTLCGLDAAKVRVTEDGICAVTCARCIRIYDGC